MSESKRPRIDKVEMSFERRGECKACGKHCNRSKTFRGATMEQCQAQADAWEQTPLMHAKCERMTHG